jgi:hypothetical protein
MNIFFSTLDNEVIGAKLLLSEKGIWLKSRATPVTVLKLTFENTTD